MRVQLEKTINNNNYLVNVRTEEKLETLVLSLPERIYDTVVSILPMSHILFVGGGSIGHIATAVSVWEECQRIVPDLTAHFVCSPRPDDAAFLSDHELPYTILDAPRASLLFLWKFFRAVKEARIILSEQKPDLIFSKGGYVSLPLCFAAKKRGIPIILHESDSVSGRANAIVARWAKHICTGFSDTDYKGAHTYTGNPIRKAITEGSREEALRITGLDGSKPILVVMGGSQGAVAINDTLTSMLEDVLLRCNVIHITGRSKATEIAHVASSNHYYQTEFANEELPHFYAAADLALSRAGAGSIAELAANGIPSILVPLRGVGHDHQYRNALLAEKSGGCIHKEQEQLQHTLLPAIHTLISDRELRKEMSKKVHSLHRQDSALQIAKIILQTLDSNGRDQ